MKTLTNLLDRFRPEARRRARTLPEAQLGAALAALDDNSPQLAAVLDQLHGQFETNIRLVLNFNTPPAQVEAARHRAAAVLDSVELLEFNRQAARERQQRETGRPPTGKEAP